MGLCRLLGRRRRRIGRFIRGDSCSDWLGFVSKVFVIYVCAGLYIRLLHCASWEFIMIFHSIYLI